MSRPTNYSVTTQTGLSRIAIFWLNTEAEAVAYARSAVGPNVTLATIEGHTDSVDTFGLRHFSWRPDSRGPDVHDAGWQVWSAGKFRGRSTSWPLVNA